MFIRIITVLICATAIFAAGIYVTVTGFDSAGVVVVTLIAGAATMILLVLSVVPEQMLAKANIQPQH